MPSPLAQTFTEALLARCDLLEPLRSLPAAEGAKVAANEVMILYDVIFLGNEQLTSKVQEWHPVLQKALCVADMEFPV